METLKNGLWPVTIQIVAPVCACGVMLGLVYRLFAG
ncbi:hypothetical protein ABIB07_003512 [Bradyrhizobium sp. RT10b]